MTGRRSEPGAGRSAAEPPGGWSVYIVRCRDGTLYTGIATDVARRLAEHLRPGGRGARYLRGRGPLELVLSRIVGTLPRALRLERRIKRLSRVGKDRLLDDPASLGSLLDP